MLCAVNFWLLPGHVFSLLDETELANFTKLSNASLKKDTVLASEKKWKRSSNFSDGIDVDQGISTVDVSVVVNRPNKATQVSLVDSGVWKQIHNDLNQHWWYSRYRTQKLVPFN